jgi:hypothetical protein
MEDGSLGQILAIAIGNFEDFLSFYCGCCVCLGVCSSLEYFVGIP